MPSCVALGCYRRRDAIYKVFPRKDRHRRQIWVDRVNRPGWTPTRFSALCERHFDRDQWELPREDGKLKLKESAVPTVFVVPNINDDAVSSEHAYCLPFYRKIYNDADPNRDTTEPEEDVMPIEHIKVEEGENANFTTETIEEEEQDCPEDYVESIQCTPDLTVFPEKGEPFPIELVECENDDTNTVLSEPEKDPLAFSAEDQVQASSMQPYFGKRQKLLFIPKETKVPVNVLSKAKGEPEAERSKSPNTETVKPRLKVKSLEGLMDPNLLVNPSSSNCENLKSNIILRSPSAVYIKEKLTLTNEAVALSNSVKSSSNNAKVLKADVSSNSEKASFNTPTNVATQIILRSPSAVYIKEKLTLTNEAADSSNSSKASPSNNAKVSQKSPSAMYVKEKTNKSNKTVASNNSTNVASEVISLPKPPRYVHHTALTCETVYSPVKKLRPLRPKVVTLTSPKFTFYPTLNKSDIAPPDLNLVSNKLRVQTDKDFFFKTTSNARLKNPAVVRHIPNILVRTKKDFMSNQKSVSSKNINQPKLLKIQALQNCVNKSTKITLKTIDNQMLRGNVEELSEKGKRNGQGYNKKEIEIEKDSLGSKHNPRTIFVHVTKHREEENGNISGTQIVNNKLTTDFDPTTIAGSDSICNKGAPFLKTFQPQFSPKINKSQTFNKNVNKNSVIVLKPLGSYKPLNNISSSKCNQKEVSGKHNRTVTKHRCDQCKTSFISPLALNIHKKKSGHVGVIIQGRDEGREKEITKEDVVIVDTSESSDSSLDSESQDETSSDSESDSFEQTSSSSKVSSNNSSDEEEENEVIELLNESIKINKNTQQTKIGLDKISSGNVTKNSKSPENSIERESFLQINQIKNLVEKKKQVKNFVERKKYETRPFHDKLEVDNKRLINVTEKNKRSPRIRLARENFLNHENISLKQSMDPKIYGTISQNNVTRFVNNSNEKELIVLSSSSESDCGDDTISTDVEELSRTQKTRLLRSKINRIRTRNAAPKKKIMQTKDKSSKSSVENDNDPCSSLCKNVERTSTLLLKMDSMNNIKKVVSKINQPRRVPEIVISDDEALSCNEAISLEEINEKSDPSLDVEIIKERTPVNDNTTVVYNEIKNKAMNKTPIILLPKLNLEQVKSSKISKTNCQKVNKKEKHSRMSKDEEVIILDQISETLEGKHKRSCYEKYKAAKSMKRITRSKTKQKKTTESLNSNSVSEFSKVYKAVKRLKQAEEEDRSKSSYEKRPKSLSRKCKKYNESGQKSKFIHHPNQHNRMTSECKICRKRFAHSVLLRRHMKKEHFT